MLGYIRVIPWLYSGYIRVISKGITKETVFGSIQSQGIKWLQKKACYFFNANEVADEKFTHITNKHLGRLLTIIISIKTADILKTLLL